MDLEKQQIERTAQAKSADAAAPVSDTAGGAVAGHDDDEGLPVEIFAAKHHLPVPEVWRKVRAGELIGRTHWGRLIIYGSAEGAKSFAKDAEEKSEIRIPQGGEVDLATFRHHIDPADLKDLPPLPPVTDTSSTSSDMSPSSGGGFLSLSGQRGESPEIALLLDHLSLAKEENREILRMTQESLRRVSELSDQVVEMKDAVIDAKEAKIKALEEQISTRDSALAKLHEEKEDLETLARAMAAPARQPRRQDPHARK